MSKLRPTSALLVGLLLLAPGAASAQGSWSGSPLIDFADGVDFATCDPDMPVCDDRSTDCCVAALDAIATDRAIVIPLDRCHQTPSGGDFKAPGPESPEWCSDASPVADDGMFLAYGLAYRLMQADIPVYWLVNPTKSATTVSTTQSTHRYTDRDIDLWILGWNRDENQPAAAPPDLGSPLIPCESDCEAPVVRLASDLSVASSYGKAQFPVRGSALVIPPEHRRRFNEFWTRTGEFAANAGNPRYDFSAVDLYELGANAQLVWQDYRLSPYTVVKGAPIAATIDYQAPRLAIESGGGVENWLALIKLDEPAASSCTSGEWTPETAVYCKVTTTDVANNVLTENGFNWAWFDRWKDNKPCQNANEIAIVEGFHTFLTAVPGVRNAGSVMFMEAPIDAIERCAGKELMGASGAGLVGLPSAMSEPFIVRYPSNLVNQTGDLPASFAQGSPSKFQYFGGAAGGYGAAHIGADGTLRRLVSEDASATGNGLCTDHRSSPDCDIFANDSDADTIDLAAYTRKDGDARNGIIFYMGGNQVTQSGNAAHLRMLFNALISTPHGTTEVVDPPQDPIEISRSAPVVATVDEVRGFYQGTFKAALASPTPTFSGARDEPTFEFPAVLGHLRAYDVADLGATAVDFETIPALFDAADAIPPAQPAGCDSAAFSGACRTVFTNVANGQNPERVMLATANRDQLGPLLGDGLSPAEVDLLISRVLAGRLSGSDYVPGLGGIDRSTVAVIEPSPNAGASDRPTMIYAGGLDGMLHAFCAELVAPCTQLGQELWAFIPRTQLPALRFNAQRVDGSPRVADVLADFDGDGNFESRTVLAFQTGSGDPAIASRAPATVALDVTDPTAPTILWERATPTARGAIERGVGLSIAMSLVKTAGSATHATFVTTNNGGTGGAGIVLEMIETATGEPLWTRSYPTPMARGESNPRVPDTGIPAGATVFDDSGLGFATHVLVPTLFGELWVADAATGNPLFGDSPLFRFTSDFHPIGVPATIYRDETNELHAVVVSGGYADPQRTAWSPDSATQYAVSIDLGTAAAAVPLSELTAPGSGIDWVIDLGVGQRAFSQAVVAGSEIFISASSRDANRLLLDGDGSAGSLRRYSLERGTLKGEAINLAEGAGGIDVSGSQIFSAGAGGAVKSTIADHAAQGIVVEVLKKVKSRRVAWLNLSQ